MKKSFNLTCFSSNSFELRMYIRRIFSKPGLQDLETHFLSEGTFQSTMEQRGCGVCDAPSPSALCCCYYLPSDLERRQIPWSQCSAFMSPTL